MFEERKDKTKNIPSFTYLVRKNHKFFLDKTINFQKTIYLKKEPVNTSC